MLMVKSIYSEGIKSVAVVAFFFVPVADCVPKRTHLIAGLFQSELPIMLAIPEITESKYWIAPLLSDMDSGSIML